MDIEFEDFEADDVLGEDPPAFVNWGLVLSVNILRELNERMPGFRESVRERILQSAECVEGEDAQETAEMRASYQELANEWFFTE